MKDGFWELNLVIASSPELARATFANAENPANAPPEDQFQMLGLWRALFHIWSNVHRQHLNGTLDPALYDAVVQEVSTYSGNGRGADTVDDGGRRGRQMQWAWESERFIFNLEFQMFIDAILGIDR